MKKLIITLALLAACSPVMAGSFKKNVVPADAQFAMHIDAEAMRSSQLAEIADLMKDQDSGELKEMIEFLGFDPTKELASVTAYGKNIDIEESGMVLIAETVNPVLSETDIIAKAKAKDEASIKSSKIGDKNVYSIDSDEIGQDSKLMFVDKKTILFSNTDKEIETGLKTLSAKSGNYDGLAGSPEGSFISINIAGLKDLEVPEEDPTAAMAKDIKSVKCYIGESKGNAFLNMSLIAGTNESATQMMQMVQAMLPFMAMGYAQEAPELAALMQKIKITQDGTTLTLKVEHPSKDIISIIKKLSEDTPTAPDAMSISPVSPIGF